MRKVVLATLSSAAFVFVACSNSDDSDEPEITEGVAIPEGADIQEFEDRFNPDGDQASVEKIGEPIHDDCYTHLPCDAEYTITKIQVGGDCQFGIYDYIYESMGDFKPGETLVQVNAELEVHSAAKGWTMMGDPSFIDQDGYTVSGEGELRCDYAADGFEDWSSTVQVGEKKRLYGKWRVPLGATHMVIYDKKFELPHEEPMSMRLSDEDMDYTYNEDGSVNEGDLTERFWECMENGGTEYQCRQ